MIFVIYDFFDEHGSFVCTFAYSLYFNEVVVFPAWDEDGDEQALLSIADDVMEPSFIIPFVEGEF